MKIEELKALEERATKGPWTTDIAVASVGWQTTYAHQIVIGGSEWTVAHRTTGGNTKYETCGWRTRAVGEAIPHDMTTQPNAALIAALRNAAPALLAVAEAAQKWKATHGYGALCEPDRQLMEAIDALEQA